MQAIPIVPVGIVRSPVKGRTKDDHWGGLVSIIELDAERFREDALLGLSEFSHVQILFHLHEVPPEEIEYASRHPRGREHWPMVGIFAQRARRRPNLIGLSTCRLLSVDGLRLTVLDLDAIDGTPVIDIKPYMIEFGPKGDLHQPKWATELMGDYFQIANPGQPG
jgi:tRNA-Thr(GGU) m(6)t(6)A37 methyltransferase TsaA